MPSCKMRHIKFWHTVDGSEIPNNHRFGPIKSVENNGINYQPQLLSAGFLNHQLYLLLWKVVGFLFRSWWDSPRWIKHPITCKWSITMVIVSPLTGVIPFYMAWTSWLISGGCYLLTNWDDHPPSRRLYVLASSIFISTYTPQWK